MSSCLGSSYQPNTSTLSLTPSAEVAEACNVNVDAFLNEIFQSVSVDDDTISSHASSNSPALSSSSTSGTSTTLTCSNCNRNRRLSPDFPNDHLCELCVRKTSRLSEEDFDFSRNRIGPNLGICESHLEPKLLYCESCTAGSCRKCAVNEHLGHSLVYLQDAAINARSVCLSLMKDARAGAQVVKESLELGQQMAEAVDSKAKCVTNEVNATIRQFVVALEERQRELITGIERARQYKTRMLVTQMDTLRLALTKLARTTDLLGEAYDSTSTLEILQKNEMAANDLRKLKQIQVNSAPRETEFITFTPPDSSLFRAVASIGGMQSSTLALSLGINDHPNITQTTGRGRPILGAAGNVIVKPPNPTTSPIIFGGEGDQVGKLCRPWGICCDRNGNILVADRSNNRIQVFSPDGTFLYKFGSHGNLPGQLDRPAGICCDAYGRIVVVDKDNHRVQIFMSDGTFLLTFGEKGSKNGQFNYPWDVASNAQSQLVVADTRNHRVQLFNSEGMFLSKYGFEGASPMWKHFDSPRGVCFSPDGHVICTDFNNHRIVVIDSGFMQARYLGCEGTGDRQFLRPQGVICDDEGNYIVADSRNNRIQVFDKNGVLIWKIGSGPGRGLTEIDRPSGVCLTLDGRIAVVDFGNHRVVLY